jgi:PAS domain S-box-containing protein
LFYFNFDILTEKSKNLSKLEEKMEEKIILEKLVAISEEFLQSNESELNYQKITDNILDISGAKYAGFNLYDKEGSKSITVAFSAPETILKKISSLLGFKLVGKKWEHNPALTEKIKSHTITHFSTLSEIAGDFIAKPLRLLLEKTFNFGEVVIVKILKKNVMLGDFTLIMPASVKFKNDNYVEIYAQQVGLLIARKKADEALRESEERYRMLFETIDEGIVLIAPDGQIIQANAAAQRFLGLKLSEIKSRKYDSPDWDIIRPDGTLMPPEEMAGPRAMVEKRSVKDVIMGAKHPDGSISWGNVSADPLINEAGELYCVVSICHDITERKKAEEALLIKDRAIQSSINAIAIADLEGNLTYINPSFLKLWGYGYEKDVLGKSVVEFWSEKEKVNEVMAALQNYGSWVGEMTAKKKDGSIFVVQVSTNFIKSPDGKHICTMASFIDITERKLAEQELKRSNAELESFAYATSHDLQEPLRMMASYAALIEKRYKDKLDSDANDFISFIVDGAKRMKQLIDDLLAFSRAGAGGKPFKNINMGSVLKIVKLNLGLAIKESKAKITWEPLPAVKADEVLMIQVFQNLIDNAIKFRGKESPIIHISAKQEEKEWIFWVKDSGIGIDPKYFDCIFLNFQRLHNCDNYPGTGIGLAIVKKIVESWGGRVWIESELQKGNTFYFTILKKVNVIIRI